MSRVRILSLSRYVQAALGRAFYEVDENGVIIARVPGVSGFFSQGNSFEEARENLRDAIEGNVILALQLGLPIPVLEGVVMKPVMSIGFLKEAEQDFALALWRSREVSWFQRKA